MGGHTTEVGGPADPGRELRQREVRGRPDGLELPDRASLAALDGRSEGKVVGTVAGGHTIDVHPDRNQRLDELRSPRRGVGPNRTPEREADHKDLSLEAVSQPLEEGDGVRHHCVDGDAFPLLWSSQRTSAATLVPIDNREVLFESEEVLEAARFVHHRQARTLLDQQEHGVGRVDPPNADPLGRVTQMDFLALVNCHFVSDS